MFYRACEPLLNDNLRAILTHLISMTGFLSLQNTGSVNMVNSKIQQPCGGLLTVIFFLVGYKVRGGVGTFLSLQKSGETNMQYSTVENEYFS